MNSDTQDLYSKATNQYSEAVTNAEKIHQAYLRGARTRKEAAYEAGVILRKAYVATVELVREEYIRHCGFRPPGKGRGSRNVAMFEPNVIKRKQVFP